MNKAPLTVTADNKSQIYQTAVPALTVSYSGFVNGQTVANLASPAVATTTATATSVPGTYPITVAGAVSGNYTFTNVAGSLVIPVGGPSFVISGAPTTATAGTPFTFTVTAKDPSTGATLPTYNGTLNFSSTDSSAVFSSSSSTLTNGVGTFTVTLTQAGSRTVTVTDPKSLGTTTTGAIVVSPLAAASLAFDQQPTNVNTGTPFVPAIKVRLLDTYGNVATAPADVTLAIASGSGIVAGTTTVAASAGIAHSPTSTWRTPATSRFKPHRAV